MPQRDSQYSAMMEQGLAAAKDLAPHQEDVFRMRFRRSERDLFGPLQELYGAKPGYEQFCRDLVSALIRLQTERPDALRHLDLQRDLEPDWF